MTAAPPVFCWKCGTHLLTREAQQARACFEHRDPDEYEEIRLEPDLDKQFALLGSNKRSHHAAAQ